MLLNQLINSQHEVYAQLQAQIEALQEQQRQIQSYLQRLGSVESKMESAAQLLQEAIAEINAVCPEELGNYQQTITGLFGSSPVAQLPEAQPPQAETPVPTKETPQPPQTETSVPTKETPEVPTVVEVTAVEIIEEPKEVGESRAENVLPLPTPSVIANMKKPDVVTWLTKLGLPVDGTVKVLKNRLTVHVLNAQSSAIALASDKYFPKSA